MKKILALATLLLCVFALSLSAAPHRAVLKKSHHQTPAPTPVVTVQYQYVNLPLAIALEAVGENPLPAWSTSPVAGDSNEFIAFSVNVTATFDVYQVDEFGISTFYGTYTVAPNSPFTLNWKVNGDGTFNTVNVLIH